MNSIKPEENQTNANDLEDTRPRRVSGQAAEPTPVTREASAEAFVEVPASQPAAVAEAKPVEDSLEDTNPVKVQRSSEPVPSPVEAIQPEETHASAANLVEAPGEAQLIEAQPGEPAVEDTNPVKVRRDLQAGAAAATAAEAVPDPFTGPEAVKAFDETIPPPPGLDQPIPVAEPPVETAGEAQSAPARPQPARKPAGKPNGKPAGKAAGKPVRKKAPAGAAPGARKPAPKGKGLRGLSWVLIPVLGLGILMLIAGLSALFGYINGIDLRIEAAKTQSALSASEQYQLGLQEMSEGHFYNARQRFEYVIQLDPSYPGATDKLAEALLYLNATATPTTQPTPTVTPTPDTRAVEELYSQSQQAMQNSDWNAAVTALLALRAKDVNYHVVDVDGMLFLALRNRGREKITKTDLEGGIYDLTLASNFAPLDTEAQALLTWSQMYITGASFWDLDWAQVVEYFSQVAPQMPNMMDSSGMTATERYWRGLFEYGNTFASRGQACKAVELYQQSLNAGGSGEVQQAMQNAAQACGGGSAEGSETPKPGKKNKVTPTP